MGNPGDATEAAEPTARFHALCEECQGAAKFLAVKLNDPGISDRVRGALSGVNAEDGMISVAKILIDSLRALFENGGFEAGGDAKTADSVAAEGCIQVAVTVVKWGCSMDEAMVQDLLQALTASEKRSHADERIQALSVLYNSVSESNPELRYEICLSIIRTAGKLGRVAKIMRIFSSIHHLNRVWKLDGFKYRALLEASMDALASDGFVEEAARMKQVILETLQGAGPDLLASFSSLAAETIVNLLRNAAVYQLDHVLELDAVQFLNGVQEHRKLVELLDIFVFGALSDLRKLEGRESGFLLSLGLDPDAIVEKMRLLTLSSLARDSQLVRVRAFAGCMRS